MPVFSIIANLRLHDIVDIVFLAVVAYHLYLWFYKSKALKALLGLLVLGIVYAVARTWGLFLTTWAFQILWQVLLILLIILFQSEIRQVLERVNPLEMFGFNKQSEPDKWFAGFSEGIFALAKEKIGALVIIERKDSVQEFFSGGQFLESEPSPEVLKSIFQKTSPLHDGAVLIRKGRVVQVTCCLPLSATEGLPKSWGTRHRAALGLSERSDAWLVVVSEERGEVSVARDKEIVNVHTSEELQQVLLQYTAPVLQTGRGPYEKIQFLISNRFRTKVGSLAFVFILWLLMAGQQEFDTTVKVPLVTKNLAPQFEIVDPVDPLVEITLRGLRKDASILNEDNVMVEIDMELARLGRRTFSITRDNIRLPNERIHVVNIQPTKIKFDLTENSS